MSLQRYSEKRLEDSFDVSLLFSEPLQFRTADLIAVLDEEFPAFGNWEGLDAGQVHDTGVPLVAVLISDQGGAGEGIWVNLMAAPGPFPKDGHYDDAIDRAITFKGAREAFNSHTSHLTISVKSNGTDPASRFKAARLASGVSAVLAGDPTCVGVLFPSGDVFASPEQWRAGAQQAMKGEWPLITWISFQINQHAPAVEGGKPEATCGSVGMAAFNGHEVSFAAAPVPPAYAASQVMGAIHLLLAAGNEFVDSDTIGVENGDERIRIRFLEEGPESQTDRWVLVHPDSSLDEMKYFGERSRPPAPPGVDNRIFADEDHMKNLLGEDSAPEQLETAMPEPPAMAPAAMASDDELPLPGPGERVFGKRKPGVVKSDVADQEAQPTEEQAQPAEEQPGDAETIEEILSKDRITLNQAKIRHRMFVQDKIVAEVRSRGGSDVKWIPICPRACEPGEISSYLLDELGLDPFLEWNMLYFAADKKTALLLDTVLFDYNWEGQFEKAVLDNILRSMEVWQRARSEHRQTGDTVKLLNLRDYIRIQLGEVTLPVYNHIFGDKQDHLKQFFKIAS